MKKLFALKNLALAVLSLAVLGLGAYLLVNGTTARPAPVSASTSIATQDQALLALSLANGQIPNKSELTHFLAFVPADTHLTWSQIQKDLLAGQTIAQIAGPHLDKVEADALGELRIGLDLVTAQGVITPGQEARLLADAKDTLSILFQAQLSLLLPALPAPSPTPA